MQHNPHASNGVTRIIGSPFVGLVFLGLALYAQTPHTQNAFFELGHDQTSDFAIRNSWAYAIALELAVLYFVVRGNFQASYIFAGVSVAMNVAYYTIHGHSMTDIAHNWTRWLVSISLPVAIAYYSHCIAGTVDISFSALLAKPHRWVLQRFVAIRARFRRTPATSVVADARPVQTEDAQPANPDKRQRAHQLRDEGLTIAQIADELGAHRNTVGGWLRTNGHKEPAQ